MLHLNLKFCGTDISRVPRTPDRRLSCMFSAMHKADFCLGDRIARQSLAGPGRHFQTSCQGHARAKRKKEAISEKNADAVLASGVDILRQIPRSYVDEIEDVAAKDMFQSLQAERISLPKVGTIRSTFVPPEDGTGREGDTPVLLLHGFDGSCIVYRRMKPVLDEKGVEAWAIDLLGNGFCASGLEGRPNAELGPLQRRQHLYAFWKQKIGRPVAIVGTSLGGAAAIDFAVAHPEAVSKLVLLAPQVLTDGIGTMSSLPTFIARLGVKVLQTFWLRQKACTMEYYDKEAFATEDAVRVGRIHTFLPGWVDATVAFMKSGGYKVSQKVKEVQQDTVVVWGAKDEILDPKSGKQFADLLPRSKLIYIEDCGHSIHLEQPEEAAKIVLEAIST